MHMHQIYMQRCLQLAAKGMGRVAPNPMVGSVIVHNGQIIGEGWHRQLGGPHAEVNAVNAVPEHLRGLVPQSTLYVNLEPCSHFGKTPPCADMIIRNSIPCVVIGSNDPNPLVAGRGIQKLRDAGVEVITGVLKAESDFLNRRFLTYWQKQRPYIILKWVKSTDGFMALIEPKQVWLSNDAAKKLSHQWRSEEPAILAGNNTIKIDNPALTVRLVKGANPTRITIDKNLELSTSAAFFAPDAPVIVFNAHKNDGPYVLLDFEGDVLKQVMQYLFDKQIQAVIIEGGPYTLQKFIDANLWDEARTFTTPHILKTGKPAPVLNSPVYKDEMVDSDRLQVYLSPDLLQPAATSKS